MQVDWDKWVDEDEEDEAADPMGGFDLSALNNFSNFGGGAGMGGFGGDMSDDEEGGACLGQVVHLLQNDLHKCAVSTGHDQMYEAPDVSIPFLMTLLQRTRVRRRRSRMMTCQIWSRCRSPEGT